MNNTLYSRPIPQWKGADSLDTSPLSFAAVELENSYLLPQWLAANQVQVGCAVRTEAISVNSGAHDAPYTPLPIAL